MNLFIHIIAAAISSRFTGVALDCLFSNEASGTECFGSLISNGQHTDTLMCLSPGLYASKVSTPVQM